MTDGHALGDQWFYSRDRWSCFSMTDGHVLDVRRVYSRDRWSCFWLSVRFSSCGAIIEKTPLR